MFKFYIGLKGCTFSICKVLKRFSDDEELSPVSTALTDGAACTPVREMNVSIGGINYLSN